MTGSSLGYLPDRAQDFRIGDVFGRSFEMLSRRFGPFLALTLIAYVPSYVAPLAAGRVDPQTAVHSVVAAVPAILGFICSSLASAAVTYGVVQELRGRSFSIGESLRVALRRFLPVLGLAIVVGLAVGLGSLLLVVPGLIVLCMYYVAGPACIVERTGVFASMARSAALTKGHRWQVFGIVMLVFVVMTGTGFVLNLAADSLGPTMGVLISAAWTVVAGTFGAILIGVLYFRLRSVKEGIDLDQIARVFA